MGKLFTIREIRFLEENYLQQSDADMAKNLKRSVRSVTEKRKLLNLHRDYHFTKSEKTFIKENYQTLTDAQISENLHRGIYSIERYRRRNKLFKRQGIYKKTELCSYAGMRNIRHLHGNNKLYSCIVTPDNQWQAEHVYSWIKKNGPVPDGMILRCRDGNTLNTNPDNWQAVTRKEHLALCKLNTDQALVNQKMSVAIKDKWNRAKIMEANGLPTRCKYRSTKKVCNPSPAPVIHRINTTAQFDFF